ncbi:hypothetical protein V493_00361 [Pseudogymnoascus sp. VKM F-4281 (FW-2241)]|nr:hypothetical protein V493_00361 [Pseudogymnoascus sp. VKM F-4281 (FW-2241)]
MVGRKSKRDRERTHASPANYVPMTADLGLAAEKVPAPSSTDGAEILYPLWPDGDYDNAVVDTVSFDQFLMPCLDGPISKESNSQSGYNSYSDSNIPFPNLDIQGQGLNHDTEKHVTPDQIYQDSAAGSLYGDGLLNPAMDSPAQPVQECPAQSHGNINTEPNTQYVHMAHIDAIGKVIACLDAHVEAGTVRIDEAMIICRAQLANITKIMDLEDYKLCTTCRTLISISLGLIVSLYEIAVSSSNSTLSSSVSNSNTLPSLFFGRFEVSTEGHSALRRCIIRTELQRPIPLLQSISSGCCAAEGSDRRKRHMQYFSELEDRITTLVSALAI